LTIYKCFDNNIFALLKGVIMDKSMAYRIWTEINRLKLQIHTLAQLFALASSDDPQTTNREPKDVEKFLVKPPKLKHRRKE
jgi:hypothetical protein